MSTLKKPSVSSPLNTGSGGLGSPPSQTSIPFGFQNQNPNGVRPAAMNDNASVSSLNMSQLSALPGSKMLQYIRSDQFGQYGESQKLYDIIQVSYINFCLYFAVQEFIAKLNKENDDLHADNERLAKSNVQYEYIIKSHDGEINGHLKKSSTFGQKMANWDDNTKGLYSKEKKSAVIEKKLDQDMNDLVEYTKWVSAESQKLKDRVRKSERVISDLKSSGESSVESLMETLYILKIKQEEMEAQAQSMRDIINQKEVQIKSKEEMKGQIKATIEVENADRENEIHALRLKLQEQNNLLDGQRKLLNELQVLCEFTQNDIIKANRELIKKKSQKQQLNLEYQEIDQATITLKNKYGMLEAQMNNMRLASSPQKKPDEPEGAENQPPFGMSYWGKPISPKKKTRSINAVFNGESPFD